MFQEEWNLPGSISEIDHGISMESPEKSESVTSQTETEKIEEIICSEMTEPVSRNLNNFNFSCFAF